MALPRSGAHDGGSHEGLEPPNHTQMPNALIDDLMKDMSEAELKITLAICRQTFGWHRKEDELSLTQFEDMTGLSRQSVITGIAEGMERGLIKRRPKGRSFLYRLKIVQNLDQSQSPDGLNFRPEIVQNLDQDSLNFRPKLVQNLDTQKKGKKESKKEKETSSSRALPKNGVAPPQIGDDVERARMFFRELRRREMSRPKAEAFARDPRYDPETVLTSIDNLTADGKDMGHIIGRLEDDPPEKGKPYERRTTTGTRGGPAAGRASVSENRERADRGPIRDRLDY